MSEEPNADDFEYYPQVRQSPSTVLEFDGEDAEIVTSARLDSDVEQNNTSFGVIVSNPTVEGDGGVWKNKNIPDGFGTVKEYNDTLRLAIEGDDVDYMNGSEVEESDIEAAKERLDDLDVPYDADGEDYDSLKVSGVDYKVVDLSDSKTDEETVEINDEVHTTGVDVDGNVFKSEEVDGFDEDRIIVWYGGMSGQRIGRSLDFNGMPFARYRDDGSLMLGLYDVPLGWKSGDPENFENVPTTDRTKLARDMDRAPRVARPPVMRDDLAERVFIAIGRYNGGRMYEAHVGRAEDDYSEFLEAMRNNENDLPHDAYEMRYVDNPEEVLAEAFDSPDSIYALYHGDGWQDEPANATTVEGGDSDDSGGGSFDVDADEAEVEHPTEKEQTFVSTVVQQMAGRDDTPDEAFASKGGLKGVVEANEDNFDVSPDIEAIRKAIYEQVDHLDADDL